jgi:phosphoribosylaminoimidazole-succinocarboxamide synthase
MAREKGLILVDTKYEFGKADGEIILIDEINTPDSSRYFYLEGYEDRQAKGEQQKQLSKEFVRQWLISNGFQGKEGQEVPEMPEDFVNQVSERYIELFENITGENFHRADISDIKNRIFSNVSNFLKELK